MKCKICGGGGFTALFGVVYCNTCGAGYDMETLEIVDWDKKELKSFFYAIVEDIKDEGQREFIKGLFNGYFEALFSDKKKVREWAINRIYNLMMQLKDKTNLKGGE